MADPTGGTIYDLGYRRYQGARLGRRHAVWALYVHSLRSVFGIGRSFSNKVGPMGLTAIMFLPAVIQLGVAAISAERIEVTRPEDYYGLLEVILAAFCAVSAPEILGRDQRTQTLSLYFSRALMRGDYALAKFAALVTSLLAITVTPQALMFTGNALAGNDFFGYAQDNWTDIPAVVASALILSSLVAGISLVIAAQTPRRAYSTVGILAAFVLTSAVAASVFEASGPDTGRFVLLLSPFHVARGLTLWIFGAAPESGTQFEQADFSGIVYALDAVASALLTLVLLLRRYERISP